MKATKLLILVVGFLFGFALAGLLFGSWIFKLNFLGEISYYPISPWKGTLRVSLVNSTKRPIEAVVALDNESVMAGTLPGRSPIPYPFHADFNAFAAFSPGLGKHELSVVIGNVGKIGTEEIVQENNKTNYVTIYIQNATTGTNRLECLFLVHTNIAGGL